MTGMLVVLVSALLITVAATTWDETTRSAVAATNPIPSDLAVTGAKPNKRVLTAGRPACRLRSAPLQWNIDWFFAPTVPPG